MMFNGFTMFAEAFELIDNSNEFARKSAWDQMFVAIDAAGATSSASEDHAHNKKKAFKKEKSKLSEEDFKLPRSRNQDYHHLHHRP